MRKIVLGFAILGLSASAVLAQSPTNFADVDTDANGELSLTELQVVWPDLTEAEFTGADIDASGGISSSELTGLQPAAVPAPGAPMEPMAPATPAAPAETPNSLVQ